MATRAAGERPLSILSIANLAKPLPSHHFLLVTILLVAAATLYCQAHCFITSPPFHHGLLMPLDASLAWAVPAVVPWTACFELCKRQLTAPIARPRLLLIAAFAIAVAASVWGEQAADDLIGMGTRPLSARLADQLPAIFLTIGALLFVRSRVRRRALETEGGNGGAEGAALLAEADRIDWIEAAGNYVEMHVGGRLLIRRLTMRQAEAMLDPARFVRIHRSAIVNRGRVAAVGPGLKVSLLDGTSLRVGHAYRSNLGKLRAAHRDGFVT